MAGGGTESFPRSETEPVNARQLFEVLQVPEDGGYGPRDLLHGWRGVVLSVDSGHLYYKRTEDGTPTITLDQIWAETRDVIKGLRDVNQNGLADYKQTVHGQPRGSEFPYFVFPAEAVRPTDAKVASDSAPQGQDDRL